MTQLENDLIGDWGQLSHSAMLTVIGTLGNKMFKKPIS